MPSSVVGLFTLWIKCFSLPLVWGLTRWSGPISTHSGQHGHINADALWRPDMLLLCRSCFSCPCDSSALLCLSLRMAFPSAGESSGGPLYPPRCCSVCWKTAAFVLSGSGLLIHVQRKHCCPYPPAISVYLCPRQWEGGGGSVVDIKCLDWLIIHGHLHKLHNAPCHFQSTADGTNVFLSGVIMTIKESSGHEIGVWWLCPVFEGLTHRRTYLFLTS